MRRPTGICRSAACCAVHELQAAGPDVECGAAPTSFAVGILARHPGPVVWIGRGLFGQGLLRSELDPRRIVFVDAGCTALHADGPDRITGEWWRRPGEVAAVCDNWPLENQDGRRFWLFR